MCLTNNKSERCKFITCKLKWSYAGHAFNDVLIQTTKHMNIQILEDWLSSIPCYYYYYYCCNRCVNIELHFQSYLHCDFPGFLLLSSSLQHKSGSRKRLCWIKKIHKIRKHDVCFIYILKFLQNWKNPRVKYNRVEKIELYMKEAIFFLFHRTYAGVYLKHAMH